MTLKEFAERYTNEYSFILFDKTGRRIAKYSYEKIVNPKIPVGYKEVVEYTLTEKEIQVTLNCITGVRK